MDSYQTNVLSYFKKTLELDRLKTVEYSKNKGSFWKIPFEEIESGQLNEEHTKELFESYFRTINANAKKQNEISSIDLLISLHAVENGRKAFGILNTVCSLSKTGELSADPSDGGPWIPNDRLSTENSEPMDIMVGELSDFWKFERKHAEELESKIETWSDYLGYAEELFTCVGRNLDKHPEGSNEEYIDDVAYVTLGDNIFASGAVITLYESLLRQDGLPAMISTLLAPPKEKKSDSLIEEGERIILNMCSSCGSMSKEFYLADSQRKAVHAYTQMNKGDVLAVSGPPGTGKTTMLQSIVANLITLHALQGKRAPVIVGTSTNNQAVTNIIDSFSSVVPEKHGVLDFRWLLKNTGEDLVQLEQPGSLETLPGIAAYCPSKSRLARAKKIYLVEQTDKSGVYSEYSEGSYLGQAKPKFLEFAQRLFGSEATTLEQIQKHLHQRLDALEKAKRDLINAAYWYIKHAPIAASMQKLDEIIHDAKKDYQDAQESLRYWIQVDEQRPKKGLFRKPASSDEDLMYANKSEKDSFPRNLNTMVQVKDYYKQKMDEYSTIAERAQQTLSEYKKGMQDYQCAFDLVALLLNSLAGDEKISNRFHSFDIQGEKSLIGLDRILDVTVRYVEFWLSVHYYECQWLIDCSSKSNLIPENERFMDKKELQDTFWRQIASLTPCLVMTEYQLPKYFTLYAGKEKPKKHDLERIDLLIVDEAGQVNSPVAVASFSLAKKAIVVGDVHQLSPVWSLTPDADKEIAKDNKVPTENWNERATGGLTSSEPSSLMRAAANACIWRYSDEDSGLFLEEHYRCVEGIIKVCNDLLYNGRLVPSRAKASKLEGVIDPFIFCVVPGSKDEKAGSSRKNQVEAKAIVRWIEANRDSLQEIYGKPFDEIVGIVTPFAAQAQLIKSVLQKTEPRLAESMTIGTAHRLQGAERPVILFSAVYGDTCGAASFIERTPELTNVAVSRAKDLFIVFGSKKRLDDSGNVFKTIERMSTRGDGMLPGAMTEKNNLANTEHGERICPASHPSAPSPNICAFEGEKNISQVLSIWKDQQIVGDRAIPSAKEVNQILKREGLIEESTVQGCGGWKPTPKGRQLGITEIPPSDGKNYYMCKYSAKAAEAILSVIFAELG